mgnify:CR=1 FL=1
MFIFAVDSFIKRDIGRNARILLGGIYGALILFLAFSFFCGMILGALCRRLLERAGIIKDSLCRFKFV